jgi:predicted GIY-YIG superfamily endonuclease
MSRWWVYVVQDEGKLKVGITTDLRNRLHLRGHPVLIGIEGPFSEGEAAKREKQLKGWSAVKKRDHFRNSTSQR